MILASTDFSIGLPPIVGCSEAGSEAPKTAPAGAGTLPDRAVQAPGRTPLHPATAPLIAASRTEPAHA